MATPNLFGVDMDSLPNRVWECHPAVGIKMPTYKKPPRLVIGAIQYNPGDVLLSHLFGEAVPSALWGLTAVFGKGTGISPTPLQPGKIFVISKSSVLRQLDRMLRYLGNEISSKF